MKLTLELLGLRLITQETRTMNGTTKPETDTEAASPNERLVMRDLQVSDCTYANNFPANICWNSCVVVQIPEEGQGVVLYTCKARGTQTQSYLPLSFRKRYTNDIYVFGA